VKNEDVLKQQDDILLQMQNLSQSAGLPKIESVEDCFSTGVLCEAGVQEIKDNPFAPVSI